MVFCDRVRGAFFEDENLVILETDNVEAVREWEDWKWFLDPNHAGLSTVGTKKERSQFGVASKGCE